MEVVRTKPKRFALLIAVMAMIIGVLVPTTPGASLARQDDGSSPTTMYEDPFVSDSVYDDADYDTYGDPCDPEIYPAWESDPYCNPAAFDDGFGDTTPGTTPDSSNYCDPTFYPDWASDPACNPALTATPTTTTTRPVVQAPERLSPAFDSASLADVPLVEIDPSEAPIVGAGRMLLAIDAIAELGGFERATTPGGAALLRDIRDTIPAVGLDDEGYALELALFVDDFIPFLESLEADGVRVSENLWNAAEGLYAVVAEDDAGSNSADLGLLNPAPWILGLGDLLVRGGEPPLAPMLERDESEVRALLSAFADVPVEAGPTTTVEPEMTPPSALALEAETSTEPPEPSPLPVVPIAAGVVLLLAALVALSFARRRSERQTPDNDSAQHEIDPAGTSSLSQSSVGEVAKSKASVTELLDASRRMSASLDASTIASIALAEANRIVGAEGGIVVRRNAGDLDPVGCEPPMLFNYEHLADGCLPRVIETGRSTASIAHDEPLLVEVPMAMAAVPIVTDGVVTGAVLVVRVSARPFDRDDIDALEMLAPLIGSAFAVAEQHESATELVDVEPLTGLQNRRRLDLDLASISTEDNVAYVMVDIDHFKNFNDTNGHAAGDEALRQVSALLQASVRPNDLVYRYGGEEFCVLLPATTAVEASVVAERARAAVEGAVIPGMENQPDGIVTISVGVSDSAFGPPESLVERADAALYVSKRNGRNQVTLSHPE